MEGEVLGEGRSQPLPPTRGSGSTVSSPSGVRGRAPETFDLYILLTSEIAANDITESDTFICEYVFE